MVELQRDVQALKANKGPAPEGVSSAVASENEFLMQVPPGGWQQQGWGEGVAKGWQRGDSLSPGVAAANECLMRVREGERGPRVGSWG